MGAGKEIRTRQWWDIAERKLDVCLDTVTYETYSLEVQKLQDPLNKYVVHHGKTLLKVNVFGINHYSGSLIKGVDGG
jgi:hypothetical protein